MKFKRLFNLEKFRQWLEEHKPDDIVGYTSLPSSCPLACFIREQTGVASVFVGKQGMMSCGDGFNSITPHEHWSLTFMKQIDSKEVKGVVLQKEALEILNQALAIPDLKEVQNEIQTQTK